MGDEQLTGWQASQLKWLKRQVDNLADESRRDDARPRIEQELFAAREELDDYVDALKETGINIEHRRRSWHGVI
jgi:biotin operon repressor